MSERLNADKVAAFIGRKTRTTDEIAQHFGARPQQAAAAVAILRIKGTVQPADPSKTADGVSRWKRA